MNDSVIQEKETTGQSGAARTDGLGGMVVATPGKGGEEDAAAWSTPDTGAKSGEHMAEDTTSAACQVQVAQGKHTHASALHMTEEANHHDVGGYDGNRNGCESVPADHRALYFLREAEASITWLRQENDYLRKERGNDEFILRRLQEQLEAVMEKERLVDEEIKSLVQRMSADNEASEELTRQIKEYENRLQAERKRGKEQSEELERLQAKCIDEVTHGKNKERELENALREKDALEERLSASEEMNKETAEQLERIKLAVKEKEDELASLQNKYEEGLNDALNQINFLKEKEKSLSEANQVFAETICEMEREKKKIQDELDESTNSNITLKASLDEAQQARQRMEDMYRNKEADLRNILDQQQKDIECMKGKASESEARISFLLHQVHDKDALVAAKESQVEQCKTEMERVLRDLEALKEEHKEYSNELKRDFEKELGAMQNLHGDITQLLNSKVSTMEDKVEELQAQIERAHQENEMLRRHTNDQLDQYKAANKELEKSVNELKEVEIKYGSTKEALDAAEADREELKQQVETLEKTLQEVTALQERSQRVAREGDALQQPSKALKDIKSNNASLQRKISRRLKATNSMMRDSKDPNSGQKSSLNRKSKLFSMFEDQTE